MGKEQGEQLERETTVVFADILGGADLIAKAGDAAAVAALAAPRFAAGEGVDAALAAPVYLRDKVALTKEEQAAR